MNSELQSENASARHTIGKAGITTCIDCRFAIAHKESDGPGPAKMKINWLGNL
jgi:cytochrome c-type protein NapC